MSRRGRLAVHSILLLFHGDQISSYNYLDMYLLIFLLPLLTLLPSATAQFQFFEQMFNQPQQPQHHEPQNVASDSSWYQQNYEAGKPLCLLSYAKTGTFANRPSRTKRIATITCVQELFRVCIFRITALVRFQRQRIRWS